MRQYNEIKTKHPDAVLLFRVGDFYETFAQDAIIASKVLGIVLTKRKNGAAAFVELAGFPHHSLETYLPKLVKAGYRVAVCDQLEDPKKTKTIVKRGVTELVTPGVTYNDQVLDHKSNNFLCALHKGNKSWGVAFLDVSTGEFNVTEGDLDYIKNLITGYQPSEILVDRRKQHEWNTEFLSGYYSFGMDDWVFKTLHAESILKRQFQIASLKGIGLLNQENAAIASGAILQYLEDTNHKELAHISQVKRIVKGDSVWMDQFTVRNLEILFPNHADGKSLVEIIDQTKTPQGSRLLKKWLLFPLLNKVQVSHRHDMVAGLLKSETILEDLNDPLKAISDIERLASKIATGRINPREILILQATLAQCQDLKNILSKSTIKILKEFGAKIPDSSSISSSILEMIDEEAPVLLSKGNVIATGINEELDGYRDIAQNGKGYLVDLQKKYSEETSIPSLKVSFNNVFGYYLEVRNTHKDKVPEEWVRKQTLVNAERYITEDLKVLEAKILEAEEKIGALEGAMYHQFVSSLQGDIPLLQELAKAIAHIDVVYSFAIQARDQNYTRPKMVDKEVINISEGRHPVIETQLPDETPYIPNDVYLDNEKQQIIMITGPNMAGKSAALRQTALICLMAQAGSFVPAKHAELGLIDKIFTRVGASDNLAAGESTFMVEMNETANILHNITSKSLVLLDELGRGTSTYDGISLAWAVAEYLHENPKSKPKTLFATHYHELNQMAEKFDRIKNYNVAVKEIDNSIVFLRKLVPGGSEHSFGIHVAKMAGMPSRVLRRAQDVLEQLEGSRTQKDTPSINSQKMEDMQLSFFQLDDPVLEQIRDEIKGLDINTLTPVEALMKLNEIKKWVGAK